MNEHGENWNVNHEQDLSFDITLLTVTQISFKCHFGLRTMCDTVHPNCKQTKCEVEPEEISEKSLKLPRRRMR